MPPPASAAVFAASARGTHGGPGPVPVAHPGEDQRHARADQPERGVRRPELLVGLAGGVDGVCPEERQRRFGNPAHESELVQADHAEREAREGGEARDAASLLEELAGAAPEVVTHPFGFRGARPADPARSRSDGGRPVDRRGVFSG
jgi:hypothetical protein